MRIQQRRKKQRTWQLIARVISIFPIPWIQTWRFTVRTMSGGTQSWSSTSLRPYLAMLREARLELAAYRRGNQCVHSTYTAILQIWYSTNSLLHDNDGPGYLSFFTSCTPGHFNISLISLHDCSGNDQALNAGKVLQMVKKRLENKWGKQLFLCTEKWGRIRTNSNTWQKWWTVQTLPCPFPFIPLYHQIFLIISQECVCALRPDVLTFPWVL